MRIDPSNALENMGYPGHMAKYSEVTAPGTQSFGETVTEFFSYTMYIHLCDSA